MILSDNINKAKVKPILPEKFNTTFMQEGVLLMIMIIYQQAG